MKHFKRFLFLLALATSMAVQADDNMIWRKTIIVKTLDNTTMEYLIDKDTKVKIEKPNLIIETEGIVLTYKLEEMGQVRYGKKLVSTGIDNLKSGHPTPFKMVDDFLYFNNLKVGTQICVITADGKSLMNRSYSRSAQISLSELTSGVYFVKVNEETYKILKK